MTNEELVNYIVCKNCRVFISGTKSCSTSDKDCCFMYTSALQVANKKDEQN